jgi:hypothetical protein
MHWVQWKIPQPHTQTHLPGWHETYRFLVKSSIRNTAPALDQAIGLRVIPEGHLWRSQQLDDV